MDIIRATRKYEKWAAQFIPLVSEDIEFKHEQMRAEVFPFFRATFYRWVQHMHSGHVLLPNSPGVLSVGDIHVENYGTWRDAEGRLIWGINDFDEAATMPYTNDLIRLATSVELASAAGHLKLEGKSACEAILDGYRTCLETKGLPFVLEGEHPWLRQLATGAERSPERFWGRMTALPRLGKNKADDGIRALKDALPRPRHKADFRSRRAGLGSLGHPRYVGLVEHEGGKVAREAKMLAPSSVLWVSKASGKRLWDPQYMPIVDASVRCRDPFLGLHGMWLVRRLAPSCSRIELGMLPAEREELKMVQAMGFELGNVHLGTPEQVANVAAHFKALPKKWLQKASAHMTDLVTKDFEAFRKAG